MSSKARCLVCESENTDVYIGRCIDYEYAYEHDYGLSRCMDCSSHFITPTPSDREIREDFYGEDYANYNYASKPGSLMGHMLAWHFAKQARSLDRLARRKGLERRASRLSVLDVGCGDGSFLKALDPSRWVRTGNDISDVLRSKLESAGVAYVQGDITAADFGGQKFDVVRINHLIEHVKAPKRLVCKLRDLLEPGGMLIGQTPNTNCLTFRLWGRYWGAIHSPRHLCLFSDSGFRTLLSDSGFTDVTIRPSMVTTGWAKSFQNVLLDKRILPRKNGRTVIYPGLILLALTPTFLEYSLLRRTSVMSFVATKGDRHDR